MPARPRVSSLPWAVLALVLVSLTRARDAHALEVEAGVPRESRGLVVVEARVRDAVPARVGESRRAQRR